MFGVVLWVCRQVASTCVWFSCLHPFIRPSLLCIHSSKNWADAAHLSKPGCDDVVGPEGIEKFCEDIGVEPENVCRLFIFFIVAWLSLKLCASVEPLCSSRRDLWFSQTIPLKLPTCIASFCWAGHWGPVTGCQRNRSCLTIYATVILHFIPRWWCWFWLGSWMLRVWGTSLFRSG